MELKRAFDSSYRWLMPSLSFLILITSSFLSYDFKPLMEKYPNWKGLFEIIKNNLPLTLILAAVLSLLISIIYSFFVKPSIKTLCDELEKIKEENALIAENVKKVFDGYLYQLSKKLEFGSNTSNCERVSIYIHGRSNHFIPFGRFSANPQFGGPGRAQYPDNQGCMSKGWQNKWHFENDMGDADTYDQNSQTRYAINKRTLRAIKMRSKLYAVQRIDAINGEPLAVLVVESLTSNRFDENKLKDTLNQEESYLSELIAKLRDHIPSLENAKQKGF
ncbi:TPA: hypothetical protein F8R96_14810 [Legionella pneumophila]|nr:hypothetical protein [Legionella pneumophila]HAU1322189.1 hypothetical protein [Legionella pneumophila]HBI2947820.1 hypothetical protein [Legionella pneumophila]